MTSKVAALLLLTGIATSAHAQTIEGPHRHQLISVPAGKYTLGEKGHGKNALHHVKLSTFRISDAETTNAQFAEFIKATGYVTDAKKRGTGKVFEEGMPDWVWKTVKGASWKFPMGPDGPKASDLPDHPVTQISGADAEAYCKWVGGRLPTIDEWEVAARGGKRTRWPWGDSFNPKKANVWNGKTHKAETRVDGYVYTAPVRSYPPNAWGLYDVIGNVFEYCADLPKSSKGRERTLIAGRGGSWWCSRGTCKFFNLVDIGSMSRHGTLSNQGFRVVFDLPKTKRTP